MIGEHPDLSCIRVRSVSDYSQTDKSPSYLELEGFDYPNDSEQDSIYRFKDLENQEILS